jgi:hypothetical protein
MSYTDEEGYYWENYWEYIENKLGLCGCIDEDITDDIFSVLLQLGESSGSVYYTNFTIEGPDKYKELILHLLDSKGLIEHGGSIRGSWLTDEGREVVKKLAEEDL